MILKGGQLYYKTTTNEVYFIQNRLTLKISIVDVSNLNSNKTKIIFVITKENYLNNFQCCFPIHHFCSLGGTFHVTMITRHVAKETNVDLKSIFSFGKRS